MPHPTVRVFRYIEELDAFLPDTAYLAIAQDLGLVEWNPVVWIGRFFLLDNDFGEHWFDNDDLPDDKTDAAARLGVDPNDLLVLRPEVFQDGKDGPQHSDEARKRFWIDVLRSLELSLDALADEARLFNTAHQERFSEDYQPDLEERVEYWRAKLMHSNRE